MAAEPSGRRRRGSMVDDMVPDLDDPVPPQLVVRPKDAWGRVKQGLGVLVFLVIVGGYIKYGHLLTMDGLMKNQRWLKSTTLAAPILSGAVFILLMMGVVALSLPGATLFCFVSGLAFPQPFAVILAWLGFSFGSALCYILVQTVLGDYFKTKLQASPQLFKYYGKFQVYLLDENSSQAVPMICIRYLLFIPHWFTNVAAPLIGVPFFLFLWTTMLSSIPGTALYTCAGAGLASVFEDREKALIAGKDVEMPTTSSVLIAVITGGDPLVMVGFVSLFVLVPLCLYLVKGMPKDVEDSKPLPGMSPRAVAEAAAASSKRDD